MKLTRDNLSVLTRYLDVFERPGYRFVVGHSKPGEFPTPFLSNEAVALAEAVQRHPGLQPDAYRVQSPQAYVDNAALLDGADAETLVELLFRHARHERFCTGHFAAMLESGHVTAILKRLKKIRDEAMGN